MKGAELEPAGSFLTWVAPTLSMTVNNKEGASKLVERYTADQFRRVQVGEIVPLVLNKILQVGWVLLVSPVRFRDAMSSME